MASPVDSRIEPSSADLGNKYYFLRGFETESSRFDQIGAEITGYFDKHTELWNVSLRKQINQDFVLVLKAQLKETDSELFSRYEGTEFHAQCIHQLIQYVKSNRGRNRSKRTAESEIQDLQPLQTEKTLSICSRQIRDRGLLASRRNQGIGSSVGFSFSSYRATIIH